MRYNDEWKDYEIIATGGGEKLERWGDVVLLRPDPQVIWRAEKPLDKYPKIDAKYSRSFNGGGAWQFFKPLSEWTVSWRNLRFKVKPMGFKHTGLFPEQAANWSIMMELIKNANRPISVLNLFAYTGAATVACTYAGATVTHVDSAKNMVERAKQNMEINGLSSKPVRYIVDDCAKFINREIKRGNFYDAIIMDPPSYGRGPNGELWKIENNIFDFLMLCTKVLSEKPLFVFLNSYTTGLQPTVLSNLLTLSVAKKAKGRVVSYEICLPTCQNIFLPCGASGLFIGEN